MRNHSYENGCDLHESETASRTDFHMKGFALRLVSKQRHNRTRKWPITILEFKMSLRFWRSDVMNILDRFFPAQFIIADLFMFLFLQVHALRIALIAVISGLTCKRGERVSSAL